MIFSSGGRMPKKISEGNRLKEWVLKAVQIEGEKSKYFQVQLNMDHGSSVIHLWPMPNEENILTWKGPELICAEFCWNENAKSLKFRFVKYEPSKDRDSCVAFHRWLILNRRCFDEYPHLLANDTKTTFRSRVIRRGDSSHSQTKKENRQ